MGDVGEVFVVDWAFSVERALGKGENQYWPSNYIGARVIEAVPESNKHENAVTRK